MIDALALAGGSWLVPRRLLRFGARRSSLWLLLTVFLAQAGRVGTFERWVWQLADVVLDAYVVGAAAACLAASRLELPSGAWLLAVLAPFLVLDPGELVAIAMRLLLPLLAVLTEIVLNIVDFVFCRLWIWLGVFRGGRRALSKLSASEWIATALVHTWVFLGVYAILGIRLRRWHAKMLVEAEVRRAFQRPFRAKIERNDFLRQTSGPEDNADELDGDLDFDARPPKRSFSDQFLNNVEVLPEMDLRQLEARHAALLLARQAKLEEGFEFAVLPDAMSLEVRRSSLLDDSWSALLSAPDTELLAPRLLVSYVGEDGVDAGGLALDWFDAVGRELTAGAEDADSSSLFALGLSSRMLIPRPHAVGARGQGEEDGRLRRGRQLLAAGRFLALGVVHGGRPLTLPISPLICKYILGGSVGLADVELLDPAFYRERVAPLLVPGGLAALNGALVEPLAFLSVPTERRPAEELVPGGSARVVTEENVAEYLQLLCEAFLCSEIRHDLQCLLQGFWDVLPLDVLQASGLSEGDIASLLAGAAGLDVSEWRRCSVVEEGADGQVAAWFWDVVHRRWRRRASAGTCCASPRAPAASRPAASPPCPRASSWPCATWRRRSACRTRTLA